MDDLNSILEARTPYRPRQRADLPLLDWAKAFIQYGFVVIATYISSKKVENPEGNKWSTTKLKLINGHSSMSIDERTHIQGTFRPAFFTLTENNEGRKEALIVQPEHVAALRKKGYALKPLVEDIVDPKASKPDVIETKPEKAKKGKNKKK